MAEAISSSQARAVRGIEAAAFVLGHAVEGFAVAGGEGAERLAAVMPRSGATRLEGEGLAAARAAIGHAAAGRRTALLASGEALVSCGPALREMARLGLPVLIVAPSHGPEVGTTLPAPGYDDVAQLAGIPAGLLVAASAEQAADFALAALRAAHDRAAPWIVAFDLAAVGLVLSNARLPDVATVQQWATNCARAEGNTDAPALGAPERDLETYRRDLERFTFALGSAMRDLERTLRRPIAPVLAEGAREPDVTIITVGASTRGARQAVAATASLGLRPVGAVQVASLRPFPAAEVVRLSWRARAVLVHECCPEPLGTGGALSDAVRASFADALTWHPAFAGIGRIPPVVTVLGPDVSAEQWVALIRSVADADPPRMLVPDSALAGGAAETRVEIAMDEAGRESALRLVVDWLARTGGTVAAHAHEPLRAGIHVARAEGSRAPGNVLLALPGGAYDTARIGSLAAGSVVVLAGDFPDRVLADTMRAAASRGVRVATLGGHGVAVRGDVATAAVVRALAPNESALDAALESVLGEAGVAEPESIAGQVRTLAEALRAQFG